MTEPDRQQAVEEAARATCAATTPAEQAEAYDAIGRALDAGADGDDIHAAINHPTTGGTP